MEKDFYGYDSLTNERIFTYGSLKRKIKNNVEVKRGNEKLLIEDIKAQIETITGKEPFIHEGGNHIVFAESAEKSNGREYYCIEWHYANNKDENIVKKVCKELNITQRELAEKIGMSADSLNNAVSNNKISQQTQKFLNLILEYEALKKELLKYENLKSALKDAVF